jgi:sulfite reductase (NADPH) flavoprotein alpha-component
VAAPATDFDSFLRAPVPEVAAQSQATSFDAFLKTQPVASSTASTDFASFLRQLPNGTPAQAGPVLPPAAAVPGVDVPLPNSAPVLVMYGTEYGFSQEIAEKLCQKLKETARFWCVCSSSSKSTPVFTPWQLPHSLRQCT